MTIVDLFILYILFMFTTQHIIDSLSWEVHLISHLYTKIDAEHMSYRPSAWQRSVEELLRYMTTMGESLVIMLKAKWFSPDEAAAMKKRNEAQWLDMFPKLLADQHDIVAIYLESLTEDDLSEELDLFNTGTPMPVRWYILEILFKNFSAYRMQLFQYLKAWCGMEHLDTHNLWLGKDKPAA